MKSPIPTHVRGFCFSASLKEELGFVWDGSHLPQEIQPDGRYIYSNTDQDSYGPLAQVRNWTNEEGESRQQTHYVHCDQIDIPREIANKDGNLVWGLLWLGQTEERNQRNGCPRIPLKDIQPDPIDWW